MNKLHTYSTLLLVAERELHGCLGMSNDEPISNDYPGITVGDVEGAAQWLRDELAAANVKPEDFQKPVEVWAEQCRRALRDSFDNTPEIVEEYIGEAEHQDGQEYWQNFDTVGEAELDFVRYKENR